MFFSLSLESGRDLQIARLSTRHGRPNPKADEKSRDTQPRVRKDGKFKIVQLSDAHLSTSTAVCLDAIGPNYNEPSTHCEADLRTLELLESVLDSEAPDLVILSGDQVKGHQCTGHAIRAVQARGAIDRAPHLVRSNLRQSR